MYCATCGSLIDEKLNYCNRCGNRVAKDGELIKQTDSTASLVRNLSISTGIVGVAGLGGLGHGWTAIDWPNLVRSERVSSDVNCILTAHALRIVGSAKRRS